MNDEIYLNEIEFRCYYYNNMPTNYYINKLSRNKYTINLFGKLRQKAKKASSTTILNGVGLK